MSRFTASSSEAHERCGSRRERHLVEEPVDEGEALISVGILMKADVVEEPLPTDAVLLQVVVVSLLEPGLDVG